MPRWGSAGCRSSTWPAGISRSRTRTAPSGRSSTARSTTTPRSGVGWRPRGTRSARRGTPRSSCTSTRTRGRGCSACCAGCSPWRSGTRPAARSILARDRMGQKPLVYRHDRGAGAWPSPASSRRCWPCPRSIVPRRVDPLALDQYLCYGYVPHPRTILEGVAKLPPAHFAVWHDGALAIERYWSPDWNLERERSMEEDVAELAPDPGRRRAGADDRRRAAGRVPLGRDRLDDRGGPDAAGLEPAGEDVRDRVPRPASTTRRITPSWPPGTWARSTRRSSSSRRRGRRCPRWPGSSTSRSPTARPCRRGTSRARPGAR